MLGDIQIDKQSTKEWLLVEDSFKQVVISFEKLERMLNMVPKERKAKIPSSEKCQKDLEDILNVLDLQLVVFQRQLNYVDNKSFQNLCYDNFNQWINIRRNDKKFKNNENPQIKFWVERFISILSQPNIKIEYYINPKITQFDLDYTKLKVQEYHKVDQQQRDKFDNNHKLYQNSESIEKMLQNKKKDFKSQIPYQNNKQPQQSILNPHNNDDQLGKQQSDTNMEEEKTNNDQAQKQQSSQNNQFYY